MNRLASIVSVLLTLILTGIITAQPFPHSAHEQTRHLQKELKLDDKQAGKVKDIFKDSETKLKALRDKMDSEHEKNMEEMDKIIDDQDKQIQNVLNDDQKKKFEELKDEHPFPAMGMPERSMHPGMMPQRLHPPMRERQGMNINDEDFAPFIESEDDAMLPPEELLPPMPLWQ